MQPVYQKPKLAAARSTSEMPDEAGIRYSMGEGPAPRHVAAGPTAAPPSSGFILVSQ
jgi:hypothetical protein